LSPTQTKASGSVSLWSSLLLSKVGGTRHLLAPSLNDALLLTCSSLVCVKMLLTPGSTSEGGQKQMPMCFTGAQTHTMFHSHHQCYRCLARTFTLRLSSCNSKIPMAWVPPLCFDTNIPLRNHARGRLLDLRPDRHARRCADTCTH
jgi:hypothetical protein